MRRISVSLVMLAIVGAVIVPIALSKSQSGPNLPALKLKGNAQRGKKVFKAFRPSELGSVGCGACHTLRAAGTTGELGPNLDKKKPSFARVVKFVTLGAPFSKAYPGADRGMPAFSNIPGAFDVLTNQQIADVAKYVSSVAGRK